MTVAQKIADIEAEMARTQRNKATEHHFGLLKAKLSKLKSTLIEASGGKGGASGEGFEVSKSGDARVGMVGFPSVGKSTLLTKLTGTFSKVAAYEFTTLTCIPGVIKYKGSKIQLLDMPGIIEGAKDGKGRGKQVIAVARACNVIIIVLDAMKPFTHKRLIEKELEGFGIRLNKRPPAITLKKKPKGGVTIQKNVTMTHLDDDFIRAILHEYKIGNADIMFDCDATEDELIDVIEGNRKYVPCLYALNKIDEITMEELDLLDRIPHYVPCSAHKEWNLDGLVEKMWEYLDLIRVYTKPKGQIPDYNAPVVLPRTSCKIEDFCNRIHRTMLQQFKTAMVWGTSVKFSPMKVGKDHQLADEDVVQIIKKATGI
jgi:small GTP-binding protein